MAGRDDAMQFRVAGCVTRRGETISCVMARGGATTLACRPTTVCRVRLLRREGGTHSAVVMSGSRLFVVYSSHKHACGWRWWCDRIP